MKMDHEKWRQPGVILDNWVSYTCEYISDICNIIFAVQSRLNCFTGTQECWIDCNFPHYNHFNVQQIYSTCGNKFVFKLPNKGIILSYIIIIIIVKCMIFISEQNFRLTIISLYKYLYDSNPSSLPIHHIWMLDQDPLAYCTGYPFSIIVECYKLA